MHKGASDFDITGTVRGPNTGLHTLAATDNRVAIATLDITSQDDARALTHDETVARLIEGLAAAGAADRGMALRDGERPCAGRRRARAPRR